MRAGGPEPNPPSWAIRRPNVTFRLARGYPILYEVEMARRREAPRREFFWLAKAALCAGSPKAHIDEQ